MAARDLKNRFAWHKWTIIIVMIGCLHGIVNMNTVHSPQRRELAATTFDNGVVSRRAFVVRMEVYDEARVLVIRD